MRKANKAIGQSISLPANLEAEKRKQQESFDLAERFRTATNPDEVKTLGDQMGRTVFGG
jgi:hypothetical protein